MEVLLIIVALVLGAGGSTLTVQDCTQMINTDTLDKCCRKPESNKTLFEPPCGDIEPFASHLNPCLFHCVFNAWNVLDGQRIVMRNLYDMLIHFNNRNYLYVNALRASYTKCQSIAEQYFPVIETYIMKLQSPCSPLPFFYVKCAEMNLLVKCPQQFWRNTVECRDARGVVQACMSMLPNANKRGRMSEVRSSGNILSPWEIITWTLHLLLSLLYL